MSARFDGSVVPWPHACDVGAADRHTTVTVALWLRGRDEALLAPERAIEIASLPLARRTYEKRTALAAATDATAEDVTAVRAFLTRHRIEVVAHAWRCCYARGTVGAFASAFATELRLFAGDSERPFLRRTEPLRLDPPLGEIVRAVVGLDEWPTEHAMHRRQSPVPPARPPRVALRAEEIVRRYSFPSDATGRGETIAILRFGGVFDDADFAAGMRANGVAVPAVERISVEPMERDSADARVFGAELAIDVQVAGALAPGARLALYGTSHGERGFLRAIAAAIFDDERRPSTLSISYGWRENRWTPGALHAMEQLFIVAALVGTSVFVASGDRGAELDERGRPHVLAPASSRFVLACGATEIDEADRETPWLHSGGGASAHEPRPPWQMAGGNERRTIPDLVAQCIPGYAMVHGGQSANGTGTSAVAPMFAALTARLNEGLPKPCGLFTPLLYGGALAARAIHPVDECATEPGPRAPSRGVAGLGTPNGAALRTFLAAEPPA